MTTEEQIQLDPDDLTQLKNYVGLLVLAWERKSYLMVHMMARNIVEYMEMILPAKEHE